MTILECWDPFYHTCENVFESQNILQPTRPTYLTTYIQHTYLLIDNIFPYLCTNYLPTYLHVAHMIIRSTLGEGGKTLICQLNTLNFLSIIRNNLHWQLYYMQLYHIVITHATCERYQCSILLKEVSLIILGILTFGGWGGINGQTIPP